MARIHLWAPLIVAAATVACASSDEPKVLAAADRRLKCERTEIETELNRETPVVREYLVGCNFMYTRVHCTKEGCYPAETEPPCIGELPCFKENPLTLRWELIDELARADLPDKR
jgi:hypothetical protein